MKLLCIDDHEVVNVKSRKFFSSKEIELKIPGLTVDKIYVGQIVLGSVFDSDPKGNSKNYKFVIYDDNHEWKSYDTDLFIPEE